MKKKMEIGLIGVFLLFSLIVSNCASTGWKTIKEPTVIQGTWEQVVLVDGQWTEIPDVKSRYTFDGNIYEQSLNSFPNQQGWFRFVDNTIEFLVTANNTGMARQEITWRPLIRTRTSKPDLVYTYSLDDDILTLSMVGVKTYFKLVDRSGTVKLALP
jgi:hypothetical protein